MRYLGIDFGSKRVGLAISDEENKIAFPNAVLPNNKNLIESLLKIIKEENVGMIVMGESNNFAGEPNKIMKEIEIFKTLLEQETKLKVIFEPEFWTSVQAKSIHGENSMHDASAASIILQSYLDRDIPMV